MAISLLIFAKKTKLALVPRLQNRPLKREALLKFFTDNKSITWFHSIAH